MYNQDKVHFHSCLGVVSVSEQTSITTSLVGLCAFGFVVNVVLFSSVFVSFLQVMLALSAHLGSLEAEKQKLRAQVNVSQSQKRLPEAEKHCIILLHFLPSHVF